MRFTNYKIFTKIREKIKKQSAILKEPFVVPHGLTPVAPDYTALTPDSYRGRPAPSRLHIGTGAGVNWYVNSHIGIALCYNYFTTYKSITDYRYFTDLQITIRIFVHL